MIGRGLPPRDGFIKSVSWITAGTVAGQLLVLSLSPVLTRIYRPEDFGLLAVFAAVLAFLTVIGTLRYELALPLADDAEAQRLLALILFLVGAFTAATAAVLAAFGTPLLAIVNAAELGSSIWLLPIGVAAAGVLQALTYVRIRQRKFARLGAERIVRSATTALSQIGFASLGGAGLLAGHVAGRVVGAAMLAGAYPARPPDVASVVRTAIDRRRFPLFTMWGSLINALGLQLPVFILAWAFGPSVVGFFSLTLRVTQAPLAVVGQATSQAFLGGLHEAGNPSALKAYSWRTFAFLSFVSIPPAGLVMIWAPDIFALVFGASWRAAGEMATFLIPWIVLSFIGQPLTSLAFALGAQKPDLAIQTTLAAARLAALAVTATLLNDHMLAVQAFGAASAAVWAFYVVWLVRLSGASVRHTLSRLAIAIGAALVIAAPSAATRAIDSDGGISGTLGLVASLALLAGSFVVGVGGLRRGAMAR